MLVGYMRRRAVTRMPFSQSPASVCLLEEKAGHYAKLEKARSNQSINQSFQKVILSFRKTLWLAMHWSESRLAMLIHTTMFVQPSISF